MATTDRTPIVSYTLPAAAYMLKMVDGARDALIVLKRLQPLFKDGELGKKAQAVIDHIETAEKEFASVSPTQ